MFLFKSFLRHLGISERKLKTRRTFRVSLVEPTVKNPPSPDVKWAGDGPFYFTNPQARDAQGRKYPVSITSSEGEKSD